MTTTPLAGYRQGYVDGLQKAAAMVDREAERAEELARPVSSLALRRLAGQLIVEARALRPHPAAHGRGTG